MMNRVLAAFFFVAFGCWAQPVPIVFDTDMGNDIDDALALAVIHSLETRGEAKLIAVTITKDNRWAAAFVKHVNQFYGRPNIPIGLVRNGKTPEDSPYIMIPSVRKGGQPSEVPEAAPLLQSVLEKQRDGSVVIAQVGFSTNLVKLLTLQGARDLIARKVKLLSIMAGQFPAGKPEYNVRIDIPAAQKLFAEWPTEIVFSGWEIGAAIEYPAVSIEQDFRYVTEHPIAEAYRAYKKMPYDRPTWDLTSVLYGIRPGRGYFSLSDRGTVKVEPDGKTVLQPDSNGKHRYLTVNEVQRAKTLEALIQLSSQPPQGVR
jgi:inosine-uridine nucleoside N-ribohydrolase